jgi:predicted dehydrogenase
VKREIPSPENVIACARVNGIWPEASWAQDPSKGGGQILSQGCHIVDLMFYLAGSDAETVYATGGGFHHARTDVFDTINAAVRFKNGTTGAFLGGDGGTGRLMMHHPAPNGCPFWVLATHRGRSGLAIDHGEDARFESADPAWKPPYEARVYSQEVGRETASGLGNVLPTFVRCILQDEPVPATVRDGARVTRFILKCFESARTGEIVRF